MAIMRKATQNPTLTAVTSQKESGIKSICVMEEDARLSIIAGIGAKNEVTLSLIMKICGAMGEDTRSITSDSRVANITKSMPLGLLGLVSWKTKYRRTWTERRRILPVDRWQTIDSMGTTINI